MKKSILLFPLFFSSYSFSQEEMETDRPDQTECSSVVKHKAIQLETGVVFSKDRSNEVESISFNYATSLIRIGLFKAAELRFEIGEYQKNYFIIDNKQFCSEGFTPFVIGTKIAVCEERGVIPQIAFIGHLELPFGDKKYISKNEVIPSFRFSLAHSLTSKISLGYNLGMEWESGSQIPNYVYTFTFARDLGEKGGVFIETFGSFTKSKYPESYFDCGFTYSVFKNLQLDASGGLALNKVSKDFFLSAGISIRLPR